MGRPEIESQERIMLSLNCIGWMSYQLEEFRRELEFSASMPGARGAEAGLRTQAYCVAAELDHAAAALATAAQRLGDFASNNELVTATDEAAINNCMMLIRGASIDRQCECGGPIFKY